MKILEYEFNDSIWVFKKISFDTTMNLIVGDSGVGKTRLLNTIFNLGTSVARSKISGECDWSLLLGIDEKKYCWNVSIKNSEDQTYIEKEYLHIDDQLIIEREAGRFKFNGVILPKLPTNEMSISILREEELIKPLFDGFSKMIRRKFFEDVLARETSIIAVNQNILKKIGKKKDLFEVFKLSGLVGSLNIRLEVLSQYFPEIYEKIITSFKDTFDFIENVSIQDSSNFKQTVSIQEDNDNFKQFVFPGGAPVFCIKERSISEWLRLDELSSGMQKVLLILTDLFSMPKGSIYLIDEYENSLGIGAIDFLPNLVLSEEFDNQLLITSHHPYIINNIPIKFWQLAHRKGSVVSFASGKELEERYGLSKQEQYIQLINDPFYTEGIE
jgi:hypothetical protein